MIKLTALIFFVDSFATAQNTNINKYLKYSKNDLFITSLKAAKEINPDSVFYLKLRSKKLKELPVEIRNYKNLKRLDLKKNKLDTLPEWFKEFKQIELLVLNDNSFKDVPPVICELKSLKVLQIGENYLYEIPTCIGQLENLEFLDIWSNEISSIPDEISDIKTLQVIDMRLTATNAKNQEYIKELLPNVNLYMSIPCKCGD